MLRLRFLPAAPTDRPTGAAYIVGHLACVLGLAALLCSLYAFAVLGRIVHEPTLNWMPAPQTAQSASLWCLTALYPLGIAADWLGAVGLARRAWWMFWLSVATIFLTPVTTSSH
ncbi:MAG: hypothetical protein AB1725_03400 [Armatimonadota bacterium]